MDYAKRGQGQRRCLRDPIPEILEAAKLLDAAMIVHEEGNRESVAALPNASNIKAVWDRTDSIRGANSPSVKPVIVTAAVPAVARAESRMRSLERLLFLNPPEAQDLNRADP